MKTWLISKLSKNRKKEMIGCHWRKYRKNLGLAGKHEMSYRVIVNRTAAKELRKKFSRGDKIRLNRAMKKLAIDPRPMHSQKLAGQEGQYRLRVGENRIVYSIDDKKAIVFVHKIKSRSSSILYLF